MTDRQPMNALERGKQKARAEAPCDRDWHHDAPGLADFAQWIRLTDPTGIEAIEYDRAIAIFAAPWQWEELHAEFIAAGQPRGRTRLGLFGVEP